MSSAFPLDPDHLDHATALALLEWQIEMGADEAMLDRPLDRFDLPARAPAMQAPAQPAPNAPAPHPAPGAAPVVSNANAGPSHADLLAEAEALARAAPDLAALAKAQQAFDGIEIKRGARNFCFADGHHAAPLMVIGEGPGEQEDIEGRPFVGPAGQMLDRMLAAIGRSRQGTTPAESVYISNVVTWRPPGNRAPDDDEIALSLPFLRRHIELAAPKVILLMGNIPCKAALGRTGILRMRGEWVEAFGRPALPMTHPAYLLRTPVAKREAWADLLSVAARLDEL